MTMWNATPATDHGPLRKPLTDVATVRILVGSDDGGWATLLESLTSEDGSGIITEIDGPEYEDFPDAGMRYVVREAQYTIKLPPNGLTDLGRQLLANYADTPVPPPAPAAPEPVVHVCRCSACEAYRAHMAGAAAPAVVTPAAPGGESCPVCDSPESADSPDECDACVCDTCRSCCDTCCSCPSTYTPDYTADSAHTPDEPASPFYAFLAPILGIPENWTEIGYLNADALTFDGDQPEYEPLRLSASTEPTVTVNLTDVCPSTVRVLTGDPGGVTFTFHPDVARRLRGPLATGPTEIPANGYDRLARDIAEAFGIPLALVTPHATWRPAEAPETVVENLPADEWDDQAEYAATHHARPRVEDASDVWEEDWDDPHITWADEPDHDAPQQRYVPMSEAEFLGNTPAQAAAQAGRDAYARLVTNRATPAADLTIDRDGTSTAHTDRGRQVLKDRDQRTAVTELARTVDDLSEAVIALRYAANHGASIGDAKARITAERARLDEALKRVGL